MIHKHKLPHQSYLIFSFTTRELMHCFIDSICERSLESTFKVMSLSEKNDLTVYVDRLYAVAVRKAGDSHVAEDIVQETFLAAVTALSKGKEPEHVWSWLVGILSNKHCDWLREKYNKPHISFEEYPLDIQAETTLDDDSSEKLEAIRRALGFLAKTHREVMIRFYLHGDSIDKIAGDLRIPPGTVKSRLHTGRRHIREGANEMENYAKQSYEPDILRISCSSGMGLDNEPFSLVGTTDVLTQNVLLLAYPKPVTETELAKALGVPVVFIEPIIEKMIDGELMQRTEGGKVYTERQSEHGKTKLELHFCIKLLVNAQIDVMDEVAGVITYADYPYRKNGGRWLALGHHYPPYYDAQQDREFWKYVLSGEGGMEIKNFRDTKFLELRFYDTELGKFPGRYLKEAYVKWFYELLSGLSSDELSVGDHVLESADSLIDSGILVRDGVLKVDIPVLTRPEYQDESRLISAHVKKLGSAIREVLLPVFDTGCVKLPPQLKSVMKWQQYMFCSGSVPMAVIHKAIESGLLLENVDYRVPASVLVIDK